MFDSFFNSPVNHYEIFGVIVALLWVHAVLPKKLPVSVGLSTGLVGLVIAFVVIAGELLRHIFA